MKILIALFFLSNPLILYGQEFTVSGTVKDSSTGEFLPYSYVQIQESSRGVLTDNLGAFQLRLPKGFQKIRFSSLGYQEDTMQMNLSNDTIIHLFLLPKLLPEVTITDQAFIKLEGSRIRFTSEALKNSIFILGETDVLKYLQLYSGVSPGVDGTNQFSVRGGGVDQNMLLMDGSILYNTSHLFGFISAVDPNSIKSTTFYKGAYPAMYSGRLSSILEVSLKEGNRHRTNHKISLGLINASAFIEGPIKKGISSYMVSFRTAYPGLFTQAKKAGFESGKNEGYLSFFMHDFNAKLNSDLGPKNTIYISVYSGNDLWSNGFKEQPIITRWNLNWGNQMISTKLQTILNRSSRLITQVNFNRFYYTSGLSSNQIDAIDPSSLSNESKISDYKFKSILENKISSFAALTSGLEITISKILPQVNFILNENTTNSIINDPIQSNQISPFITSSIRLNKYGTLDIGIRLNVHTIPEQKITFSQLEPRLKWEFKLSEKVHVFSSFMRVHQYVHLISNPSSGYVTDVWVPVTNKLAPQEMDEFSIGVDINKIRIIKNINFQLFYRQYNNQTTLRPNLVVLKEYIKKWEDLLAVDGAGKAYGIESSIQYSIDKINIISSYTFSLSKRKFDEINSGSWYFHELDRRHIVNSNFTYRINKNLVANSNFTFNTGQPVTIPKIATFGPDPTDPKLNYIYEERNNARAVHYIRLDLGIRKEYTTKNNNTKEWSLGIYNVLLNRNTFFVDYTRAYNYEKINTESIPYFKNEKIIRSYLLFIPGLTFAYTW